MSHLESQLTISAEVAKGEIDFFKYSIKVQLHVHLGSWRRGLDSKRRFYFHKNNF